MWTFCISHLDLIEKFTYYFHEKADPLIRKCHDSRIVLPDLQLNPANFLEITALNSQYLQAKENFLRKINIPLAGLNLAQPSEALTEREKECLSLMLTEQTAKRIAEKLNLSVRTVETHINNIREKFQCANKTELIIKITSKIS